MLNFRASVRRAAGMLLFAIAGYPAGSADIPRQGSAFPQAEKLTYSIQWRLVTAGTANVEMTRASSNNWKTELDIESAGLVSRLYRVLDKYRVFGDDRFCSSSVNLDAQEGKRHIVSELHFDDGRRKVVYDERDLIKNTTKRNELDVAPCSRDIVSALEALRGFDLPPGKSMNLPITDGKKVVSARIEAQGKETIENGDQKYQTVRYEAFVFDNVLYRRKGRLFVWISDDAGRLPVQFRMQLGFPVGTVSLDLVKHERVELH